MATNDLTDAQIVARVLKGDQVPYGLLVERHQPAVFNAAYRLLGHIEEAADITQEAFLRAYQALDSYQTNRPLAPWLCRIAMNACLNWRKRENRRQYVHDQWAADNLEQGDLSPGSDDPDELSERVQSALNRLPARQRAAVVLTIYGNMSHAEAARALGCAETTISWRLFAARGKLKRWLKPR